MLNSIAVNLKYSCLKKNAIEIKESIANKKLFFFQNL